MPGGVWLGGAALASASFIYRMLLARFVGTKRYTIVRADAIGHGVVELSLKPDGDVLKYFSGQFVYLTPLDPGLAAGRGEEHPYTVSSAPREPVLRVAIKNLGDASRALQTAAVGGAVLIEGPYGGLFPAEARPMRELWIAGGIGITPFLSRARSLEAARPVDVLLVYCVQDVSRAHFLGELESVAAHIPGFRFRPHYFYREGPLTAAFLRAHCPDFVEREIFVCGPAPLIAAARGELLREGVPAARLHSEDFTWL
jgi:ferredoxin-NADP reductase